MPFFGFLGGVVLATLAVVLLTEYRRRRAIGRSLDWLRLPWSAYGLALAYAALFIVMWAYYFDGDFTRMKADLPDAELFHIVRGYLFQLESGDFIVTLLAFLCGGLAVAALARAGWGGGGGGGGGGGDNREDQAAQPQGAGAEGGEDGLGAAALRQLRRITALNTLLVFALFLFTLPALLPWIERRLDSVKVGSVEARFAPLAENTRRSGTPDTPALASKVSLANYMALPASIERITTTLGRAPDILGRDVVNLEIKKENYQQTLRFFNVFIIPRVARMKCMIDAAGTQVSDIPGTREAAMALLSTLRDARDNNTATNLPRALDHMRKIDAYFYENYYYLSEECANKFNENAKRFDTSLTPLSPVTERRLSGSLCTRGEGPSSCLRVIQNGYTVRFILEFVKISSPFQNSEFLGEILDSGDVNAENYGEFAFTELDKFNIQLLKAGYMADLPYDTSYVLAAYTKVRETAAGFLDLISESCGLCPTSRRPKPGLEDAYEGYRRLMERYVDAEAVASVGAAMLKRLPLNDLHGPEAAALELLVREAGQSRAKILNPEELSDRRDTWAAAVLDEGIATIKYVQLVEEGPQPPNVRETCAVIEERLRRSVKLFQLLQTKDNEHRIDRMRAERTLYLAEQVCD